MSGHVLVVRPDNNGDVLLAGPAVRAVAASADEVTLWVGPRGRAAAGLLPGVDRLLCHPLPWIDPDPSPVNRADVDVMVDDLAALQVDRAFVLTSFHQSPLPTALLLRMAGVPWIAATSVDYPGSLLDVRHRISDDVHEVTRALDLVAAGGCHLPPGDDAGLAVRPTGRANPVAAGAPYVVVHPGASVPARALAPDRLGAIVEALRTAGWRVVVTGGPDEKALTAMVAGPPRPGVVELGGATDWAGLGEVVRGAAAIVVGNTGPAHLAAAVGTPVVSLYAPTVPAVRWRPWQVASVLLGDQQIPCAGCRARECPVAGHPCLAGISAAAVVAAVRGLAGDPAARLSEVGA